MEELKKDAELLAEAHRNMCTKDNCTTGCPEASPLFWGKALMPQRRKVMPIQRNTVATTLNGVAAMVEKQARVIDDVSLLVQEFDGSPEDVSEFLTTLRQVLSRDV